ncbi:PorT family protein [bacterium]|nr:PorT family protein [bacterium]
MRKRVMVVVLGVVLVSLSFSTQAFAQLGIRKGIKLGYTSATLAGDGITVSVDPLKNLTGGVCLEFNMLIFSLEGDVLYEKRGADFGADGKKEITYISIPLLVKKKFLPMLVHPYIMGGSEFNYLISAKKKGVDIKENLNSQDMCLTFGAGIEFSFLGKSAFGEFRYSYGLNNLAKDSSLPSERNRASHIMVGILF